MTRPSGRTGGTVAYVQRTGGWNIASLMYLYTKEMRTLKQAP